MSPPPAPPPPAMSATPRVEVGDVVISKFGNRWTVEAVQHSSADLVVMRNKPQETPGAKGTVYSGLLPEWAERIERAGLRFWHRPTPQCQCPAYANAKGPYPSGFCPECKQWYPPMSRERARELGHIE